MTTVGLVPVGQRRTVAYYCACSVCPLLLRAGNLVGRREELVELVVREPSVEEEGCESPMGRQRAGSLPGGHTRKYRPRTFSQVRARFHTEP